MGKKGSWFSAVKKALGSEPKEKKDQVTQKSKRRWFRKNKKTDVITFLEETTSLPVHSSLPALEEKKSTHVENAQTKHAYSVALASAVAAEAAVAAAQAAAEVVRLTTIPHYVGKSKDEIAAIKIQTAFRGYLARRALRALRGLVRLKLLLDGQSVKRQVTSTLRCMQTLARLQSEIRSRRLRLSEENQALQHQLHRKHEKELEKLRVSIGEDWDDRTHSKEQVEAKILNKQEAAFRRERALAYAFSHQQTWKNSSKSVNQTFMDPVNPHWGWSWLERWMASRPWETRNIVDYHDRMSLKTIPSHGISGSDVNKAYARRDLNLEIKHSLWTPPSQKSSRPPSRQSPSTPSKAPSSSRKIKQSSPRGSGWGGDNDSRSVFSVTSERCRRHSIAGSSVRDDESLVSASSVPSYMSATESTKAKSRFSSPAGVDITNMLENGSSSYVKKRLSFSSSPAPPRRHSGPPMFNTGALNNS